MKSIDKQKLTKVLENWGKEYDIIAPVESHGSVLFSKWSSNKKINLKKNTDVSPKEIFFPRTEKLYEYQLDKENVKITAVSPTQEEFIVFGIKPCDLHALDMLDDVFLNGEFVDIHYKAKREKAIIVAYLCSVPERTCFCTSLGINYQEAKSADIVIFEDGDYIAFAHQTERGEKLLAKVALLLDDVNLEISKFQEQELKVDGEGLDVKLLDLFEHPFWDEAHEKCIGCGVCTYVCPTCHCFDMNSQSRGKAGFKTRCWDSCMFPDYTLMAGGHNPRPTIKERFRNRFLHKLQYFPEKHGEFMCVGCGRCISKCPVNVDITAIIAQLKGVNVNGN